MIPLQAMYMLTLSSYLEERAAKVRREALGCIQVALAGAPPSSFYTTVDKFFGYREEEEEEGGDGDEKADEGAAWRGGYILPERLSKICSHPCSATSSEICAR